jgi:stage V sporulation protein AD
MAEGLIATAMAVDGQYADTAVAMTSSHYCSAERQYRMPLEYGGQRLPTAQWTVTGAGACIVGRQAADGLPRITHAAVGKIVDAGVTEAANMGGAMAPAAYETLRAFWDDTKTSPNDYDLIVTGDLGSLGKDIVTDLFKSDGVALGDRYHDCGMMIYDTAQHDVHAGGSGCGCSAVVLCGHILERMRAKVWRKVLFCGTGALMSPVSVMQGESIPCIAHCVCLGM